MERSTDNAHPSNESGKRVYPDRPTMLDVPTTMAAIASATERVRLAPSVLIAPYRHPLNVAHQFATIDVLSGGRVLMGVGSGWERGEFAALGASYDDRGAVTEECIEVWKAAWTQDWISHSGRFFQIHDVSMDPKPVQRPHPPIVYGAVTKPGARRAARVAYAIYPMFLETHGDPARFEPLREEVLREAERIGRDVSGFEMYAFASCLPTDGPAPEPRPTLTGTPEQILGDLERFAASGYSLVAVHLDVRSGTMAEYGELVDRVGREVVPAAAAIAARPFA
jgi:probable F420-dependent oxidoreductase